MKTILISIICLLIFSFPIYADSKHITFILLDKDGDALVECTINSIDYDAIPHNCKIMRGKTIDQVIDRLVIYMQKTEPCVDQNKLKEKQPTQETPIPKER